MAVLAAVAAACTSAPSPSPTSRASGTPAHMSRTFEIAAAPYTLPAPVEREVAVTDGSRVILAGGLDASGASTNGVYSLNPHSGHVAQLGTVPQPFHDGAGAIINGTLYIFGGGTTEGTDVVQSFDLEGRTGAIAGHLPQPLSDLQAATVGSTVYLVGGWNGKTYNANVYATTDGVHFTVAGKLPQAVRYPAVAASGSDLVIAGGSTPSGPVATVRTFDPATGKASTMGSLRAPVEGAAAFTVAGTTYVAGGADQNGRPAQDLAAVTKGVARIPVQAPMAAYAGVASDGRRAWIVGGSNGKVATNQVLEAQFVTASPAASTPAATSPTGSAASSEPTKAWPAATSGPASVRPFAGLMLIADRGNNRLLAVNAQKKIVWRFPTPGTHPIPFYFPDDGFFVHGGHAILVNEEENNIIVEIAYPSGKLLWMYGHPGVSGAARGYLHQPDDAYPYPGGGLVVADALNCRILFMNRSGHASGQIGQNGNCSPNLPKTVGYPNGDTPLADGNLLISELHGGKISEVTSNGNPVWSINVRGIHVPSDPQRLSDGSYLVVDYRHPGKVVRFTDTGKVLWSWGPTSGPDVLDHPSLAVPLPNGLVAINDDYNNRVLIVDPATNKVVWQYGTGQVGQAKGMLNIPDGVDLLLPDGSTPLHLDFPGPPVSGKP